MISLEVKVLLSRGAVFAALSGALSCGDVTLIEKGSTSGASTGVDVGGGSSICPVTKADCDHDGTCETSLGTIDDCGGCGDSCSDQNGTPSCVSGQCQLSCDPGYANCNGKGSDGCESQLSSDPQNCGGCGKSCGASTDCFQNTCVDVLAHAVGIDGLALVGDSVYFTAYDQYVQQHGLVGSVPVQGGPPTAQVSGQVEPGHLQTNGSWLVWSDWMAKTISRVPVSGTPSPAQIIYQGADGSAAENVLAVDANSVYFSNGSDLWSLPIGGGAPTSLASGFQAVNAGFVSGGDLYFVDWGEEDDSGESPGHPNGFVRRLSLSTHQVTLIADHLDTPSFVTVSGGSLYWAESGSMATYGGSAADDDVNLGTLGRVVRANLDGSSPTVLVEELVGPCALAVDQSHVYIADRGTVGGTDPKDITYYSDGNLIRVPVGGGPSEVVVPAIDARQVVLSDDSVFVASNAYDLILKRSK